MKTSSATRCAVALAAVMLFNLATSAQTPAQHPSQTIKISVTFDGPDAGKVTSATMNWYTDTIPANQPGFNQSMYSGQSQKTAPNTFEISFTIPDNQASGEYTLTQIRAIANNGTITINYNSPADFPARKVKIDNPNTFVKPSIKDVKELP